MTSDEQTPADRISEENRPDEGRIIRERYEKAARLAGEGKILYAQNYDPTCTLAEARAEADALIAAGEAERLGDKEYRLAARIVIVRSFGKAAFLVARDGSGAPGAGEHVGKHSGQLQFYVKHGVTDEPGFEFYKNGLDAGDIVGVRGRLFLSNKGELSLKAEELHLLTKSVRPLPEKWHGLTNVDIRYRQRYVDLIVNPEVAETFKTRSRIISFLRSALDKLGYMEVETPMMQTIYGGATAKPFVTHHNALDIDLYLRIAPELFLKRLIVGGFGKVYEINRNFRNEGLSTRHNPEFTMLELYTAWWDYNKTLDLTEDLIRSAAATVTRGTKAALHENEIELGAPFRRLKILDAVAAALDLPESHELRWGFGDRDALWKALGPKALEKGPVMGALKAAATSDAALMTLFEDIVEPLLIQPSFMIDFPKSLCPLAKSKADDPHTAERFELFIGGMEIANAYSELNDPKEQLARFQEQVAAKKSGDEEAMNQVDADYVRALEYGMPPCSGLGIGIDRLVMLLTKSSSIRDVILFPTMRPE